MTTQYLRKEKVIAVVTSEQDDDGNITTTVEHRVYDSISKAKRASWDIGLGMIRNVDRLPEVTA